MATFRKGTIDIEFEVLIKKGAPLNTPGKPHLIAFEGLIEHAGEFQSMEVATFRDRRRANNIGFYSFKHTPDGTRSRIKFQYNDGAHHVIEHEYRLEATLHFLT